ncbi:hypothetical protein [Nocardioides marmoraquaticus]
MPTLTREARALLPLVLSAVLIAGGLYNLVFVVASALSPLLEELLPPPFFAVLLALPLLALAVWLLLTARGAAREGVRDAWHHVAVTASWLSLVLVVMSAAALVGAMLSRWPSGSGF